MGFKNSLHGSYLMHENSTELYLYFKGQGFGRNNALDDTVTNFSLQDGPAVGGSRGNGQECEDDDDLRRAVYMLKGLKTSEGVDYLIQTALSGSTGTCAKTNRKFPSNFYSQTSWP